MDPMPISEILCPIDIKNFPQYNRFKEYDKIICIEAPVIYDQCIKKKCLMDINDPRIKGSTSICPPGSYTAVSGLYSYIETDPVDITTSLREFRDFKLSINNISSTKISSTKVSVTINYSVNFKVDVFIEGTNQTINVTLPNLVETTTLTCPRSLSQISASTVSTVQSVNEPIFKVLFLPDLTNCSAYFEITNIIKPTPPPGSGDHVVKVVNIYLNLCYSLMIKCELESQILVPFYGFFNNGKTCTNNQETCPCIQCLKNDTGLFYPPIDFSSFHCGTVNPEV